MTTASFAIHAPGGQATARVAPELGFNLYSFVASAGGEAWEVLWHDPAFLSGTTRPSRSGIPLLFPFPGRLSGKQLTLEGRTYTFDVTDPLGNAIHGFVYTRPWRVVHHSEHAITGEFHASLDDPNLLQQWPSDFRLRATYELAATTLTCRYEVFNPGPHVLPWGLGTHPYFRVTWDSIVQPHTIIKCPVTERWDLNNMLPTGQRLPVPEAAELAAGTPFTNQQYDDVFTGLTTDNDQFTASLVEQHSRRCTTISFGKPFRECVVFVPPHREAICIEPYSCVPDAYRLRAAGIATGLIELKPGDSYTSTVTISASHLDAA
jgi:aldose 1-epimerase